MPPSEAEENKQTIETSSNIEHSRTRTHEPLHTAHLLPVTMPGKEELPDWYDALSIPQTADEAAIRKAYRNLARQLHPDKNVGKVMASKQATLETMLMPVCCVIVQEEWAANRFVVVKKAYEGLQDPEKRAALDKQLKKKRMAAKRYAAATAKQQQMRKGRWCQCAPLSPSHTRHSDTHSRGRQLVCFLPELDRAERTAEKEKNESRRTQWAAKDQVQCWAGAATACITSSLV